MSDTVVRLVAALPAITLASVFAVVVLVSANQWRQMDEEPWAIAISLLFAFSAVAMMTAVLFFIGYWVATGVDLGAF